MAAIDWAAVVNEVPAAELASVGAAAQDSILAFVAEVLNVVALGGEDSFRLRRARLTLAAHLGTLARTQGTMLAGPVISELTGRISRTYAQMMTNGEFYGTSYGQEFSRIVRNAPGARLPRVF